MIPGFYDLCLLPDPECLWSQSAPNQLLNGCFCIQHPWELLTNAVHIAWLMLSQGSTLFSLYLLNFPPALSSTPSCFLKCVFFSDIQSLKMRWLVPAVKTWRQQPYYQDVVVHGHFLQGKPLRTFFICLFVFYLFVCLLAWEEMQWMGRLAWYSAYTVILVWIKESISASHFSYICKALWWPLNILFSSFEFYPNLYDHL